MFSHDSLNIWTHLFKISFVTVGLLGQYDIDLSLHGLRIFWFSPCNYVTIIRIKIKCEKFMQLILELCVHSLGTEFNTITKSNIILGGGYRIDCHILDRKYINLTYLYP